MSLIQLVVLCGCPTLLPEWHSRTYLEQKNNITVEYWAHITEYTTLTRTKSKKADILRCKDQLSFKNKKSKREEKMKKRDKDHN